MNRCQPILRGIPFLALLLGILACGFPVSTRFNPPTQPAFTPRPSSTVSAAAASTAAPSPTDSFSAPAAYQPIFEPAGCAFEVPPGADPDCGYLVVPEDRARADSPLLRLHVAIFHSRSENLSPDPVLYLSGGPGSSALELTAYLFRQGLDGFLDTRDWIIFDQRGTGYSQPALTCPERDAVTPRLLTERLSPAEREAAIVEAFQRCRDRLSAQGVDLGAYSSAVIAADVEDLRQVLGYEQFNLYAVSYGTRLALTLMREYPQTVRSAVLDSALPLQASLYTSLAPNAERAFDVLFERCAADPDCASAHPDLKADFFALVDQLNANPLPVALLGLQQPVLLDGGLLIDVVFVGLYNPLGIAAMPAMISQVSRGDVSILADRLSLYLDTSTALGQQMAVICAEEIPFSSPEQMTNLNRGVDPRIAGFFQAGVRPLFPACAGWRPSPPDPRENQPVPSNIPALILAGEYDPITPPDWGRTLTADLSRSAFYEFPANGHWVTRSSPCARAMVFAFLEDPSAAPEDGCIAEIGGLNFQP